MHINDILKVAVERKASDIHIKVGAHPVLRIDGRLQVLTEFKRMMQEDTIAMAFSMMSSRQKERFKHLLETDIAYSVPGMGRFRCNIFMQRGTTAAVFRRVPFEIAGVEDLNLPEVEGEHVLLLDDILDSGRTLHAVGERLSKGCGAASVRS